MSGFPRSRWPCCLCVFVSVTTLANPVCAADRFSGEGQLVAADPTSTDGRFTLKADLQANPSTTRDGRFSLSAQLVNTDQAKGVASCTINDALFLNGFE
jgi:hypothetical protein